MPHQKPATPSNLQGTSPFVVAHDFDDVDELAAVAQSWDLDIRQLDRGSFQGDVVQALLGPLHLARTRLGGVLHQRGTTPAGLWTFGVPRALEMDHCWRGHRMDRDDLLIHRPGCEFESISKYDFDLLLISVSGESLENAGRRLGMPVSGHSVTQHEIVRCEPQMLNGLRRLVNSVLTQAIETPSTLQRPETVKTIDDRACNLLVQALAPSRRTARRTHIPIRRRLVESAIRIAGERAHEVQSVNRLCTESGASERTLRRGFHERFGITPKEYLQAQRLIGVRRQLRTTAASTPISDIANQWGFWHMGQFAADYRRQFGELPSETLRPASPNEA